MNIMLEPCQRSMYKQKHRNININICIAADIRHWCTCIKCTTGQIGHKVQAQEETGKNSKVLSENNMRSIERLYATSILHDGYTRSNS